MLLYWCKYACSKYAFLILFYEDETQYNIYQASNIFFVDFCHKLLEYKPLN